MIVQFSPGRTPSRRGSFIMRGEQIAAQRTQWFTSHKLPKISPDIVVMVKKIDPALKRFSGKVVYDMLDCWHQPFGDSSGDGAHVSSDSDAVSFFTPILSELSQWVDSFIFPTQSMQNILGHLVPHSTVIYHHYHPGIKRNPLRDELRVVGYQGRVDYLGPWRSILEDVCDHLGLLFLEQLTDLSDADVVVALRGGVHDNFLTDNFKSNVKLANAYGSGTPIICQPSAGYLEVATSQVRFCIDKISLREELIGLASKQDRREIQQDFLQVADNYAISTVARQYEDYFKEISCL